MAAMAYAGGAITVFKGAQKRLNRFNRKLHQYKINQFSGPAYPWGVARAAARVRSSKHLDPLQQRTDALLRCQGETN